MPVCADESVRKDQQIVFNAGTEAIRMRRDDFARLVHPVVAPLSTSH